MSELEPAYLQAGANNRDSSKQQAKDYAAMAILEEIAESLEIEPIHDGDHHDTMVLIRLDDLSPKMFDAFFKALIEREGSLRAISAEIPSVMAKRLTPEMKARLAIYEYEDEDYGGWLTEWGDEAG